VLLGLAAFGLFGLTAGPLQGYENETAAVAEGLVKSGKPQVLKGSPLAVPMEIGRSGVRYGRATLTQPLLEVPFYWLGEKLDDSSSNGHNYRWRLTMLQLFDPAMAALAVAAIFTLLTLRGVAERRAMLVTALCAVGTLIWPYSKIGMDTTLMAMFAITLAAAAWVVRRPSVGRSAALGLAIALTINSKAYGALLVIGALPLFAATYVRLSRERRVWILVALTLPVAAGVAAAAWYNWYRTGSVSNFGDPYVRQRLLAMPFSALGLVISPGKGLVFYSPLVVLGSLGLRDLRRVDRPLTRTIVVTTVISIVFVATSVAWTDETWGPRYLVPIAWLLVVPIAWWLTDRRRRRWLVAIAAVAVCIQFVGVFAAYGVIEQGSTTLAGQRVYDSSPVAYGDDGPRWVPLASPLLFQIELTAADLKEGLTGSGFVVTYLPWRGHGAILDLRHPDRSFGPLPDFWWTFPGLTTKQDLLAVLLALLFLGSAAVLALDAVPGIRRRLLQRRHPTVGAAG
jgi:hypothetical protein